MTRMTLLALMAAVAATPALAQDNRPGQQRDSRDVEQRGVTADDDGGAPYQPSPRRQGSRRLTVLSGPGGDPLAMTVDEASDWADLVCNGDSILLFDIDENGDAVESSYDFDCLDEL